MLLLINGMPVFHIELKRSGVPVSQAYNQIQTYAREGVFSGLFALVQIFVAMEPQEALYFANPGPDGKFNRDFAFHWADFNNEPINDWKRVAEHLLSIPMAHQLIGFYTVADEADGVLKVLRSYQYYAAHAISDTVAKTNWQNPNRLGGFIWHTTAVTSGNINDYGRFDALVASVDRQKARQFIEVREGSSMRPYQVSMKVDELLREFVLQGGGDIEVPDEPA